MKQHLLSLLILLLLIIDLKGQTPPMQFQPPSASEIEAAPVWAKKMYGRQPNVFEVEKLYREYFRENIFTKSYHTQYFKRWRRAVAPYIQGDGRIEMPSPSVLKRIEVEYLDKVATQSNSGRATNWQLMGPGTVYNGAAEKRASQSNVYSIDQSLSNPAIMYCGTEPGEVYKSVDGGMNWASVSDNTLMNGGKSAIEIDPTNPDIVFTGTGGQVFRTADGGLTWTEVLNVWNLNVNEILVNPANPNLVLVAANAGLYRSTDGGLTFISLFTEPCYDLKMNSADNAKVYLAKNNTAVNRAEFFISSDSGATWTVQLSGWYNSTDPDRSVGGARIAITNADPNRVYCYLIGQSKADDFGFIGVYRSDDGGLNWSLPNGPAGGPYTAGHPNLAYGYPAWTYHQGFYNCAIMCSNTNADSLLIGGLNCWRSNDGGLTFESVAGYVGGPLNMHVDMQDFRAFGNESWITTDGGIYKSTDLFTSQPEVRMDGVHSSDFWGFGSGWNETVLVGGLYHNGNLSYYETWPSGDFLSLGGGESATGYVNPGENRKVYHSDIGGRVLPLTIGDPVGSVGMGMWPNEAYWAAESSEMEWHPDCYSILYLGRENKLWKSEDAGASFSLVKEFGIDAGVQVKQIEISREDPDVMYVVHQTGGYVGSLWRTLDGGVTWTNLPIPTAGWQSRVMAIAAHAEEPGTLWLGYTYGGDGTRIFKTTDFGASWSNLTTATLNGEDIHSLVAVGGTDDGIYYCSNKTVFYRNNTLPDWVLVNSGLPVSINTDKALPFYKESKIRIASYGKGIWESELEELPSRPVAKAMVNQLQALCPEDTFYFEDYSMLNHTGATWSWTFENGIPATSNLRNPAVTFTTIDTHKVTLIVTDALGTSDSDTIWVAVTGVDDTSLAEDFESTFPPLKWWQESTGGPSWSKIDTVGAYGSSSSSMRADNYNNWADGHTTDIRMAINFSSFIDANLTFDVAYAPWGGGNADTLEVLASTDCGNSWDVLFHQGGLDLSVSGIYVYDPIWVPSASDWKTDTVDLSSYVGEENVQIAFRNIGKYGQALYIDNINMNSIMTGTPEPRTISGTAGLYPNPVIINGEMRLSSDDDSPFRLTVFDLTGKEILKRSIHHGDRLPIGGLHFSTGTYLYLLEGSKRMFSGKIVVLGGRQ